MLRPAVFLLLGLTCVDGVHADEATLPDGSRPPGQLVSAANGQVLFRTANRSVALSGLVIRFNGSEKVPLKPFRFRVALTDGSTFSADLLGLDDARLRVRTAWADELALPRSAVAAVTHLEESTTPTREDFVPANAISGPSEPQVDEIVLTAGDQLFGRVVRADRDRLQVQIRRTTRDLNWDRVRELRMTRTPIEPKTTEGEHVRIWVRSAAGASDALLGVLRSLDAQQFTLAHPLLGEVSIARERVLRLQGLFQGRRQEIDPGDHHLGDAGSQSATRYPRRAEGVALRRSFRLTEVPATARLQLDVMDFRTDGTGRLELWLNAKKIADLSKQIDPNVVEPRRVNVELPSSLLRLGLNELELRLTPLRDSERHPSCGVSRVVLEMPR